MLVKQFFHPREGDYESDPNEMGDYRLSQGSQGSADNVGHISYGQSRNVENNGGGYGGLSATPRHPGGQQGMVIPLGLPLPLFPFANISQPANPKQPTRASLVLL
jgi:bud emergence protein 1